MEAPWEPWEIWIRGTALSMYVRDTPWLWPTMETLHFIGLSLLIGTVGLFDLRVLGVAKQIPRSAPSRRAHFSEARPHAAHVRLPAPFAFLTRRAERVHSSPQSTGL